MPRPRPRARRGRAGLGALLLGLALAACNSAPAASPAPSAAAPGLAAARLLVFTNHYGDAEAAFGRLLSRRPGDVAARAWHALLLNYRHDFPAAQAEAEAAAREQPRSGLALAVLCRVHDWSNRLEPALTAGRAAVARDPGEPLAHLFLSEALADHGDTAAAVGQLSQAEPLVRAVSAPDLGPYLRAELSRERANLAHDQGDPAAQLLALATAREAQPRWVERLGELAQVQLQTGQVVAARQTLGEAIASAPTDPAPLRTLLGVALAQADYPTAATLLPRALALAGGEAELLDLQGQVAMASAHDPLAARAALLEALRREPGDTAAAAYLLALARYAGTGDESAAHTAVGDAAGPSERLRRGQAQPGSDPDAAQADAAGAALGAVNAARALAGVPAVHLDAALSASAAAHDWYWLFNNAAPEVSGLGIHRETPGRPAFRGVHPWDRATAAGYPTRDVGEDITHRGSAPAAVADWVDSVYHRFPILRPDLVAIGYAQAGVGPVVIEDMEFGFDARAPAASPVLFPADGQAQVPASFVDNELPDPVPPGALRTTGYPVSVTFAAAQSVRLRSFTLRDQAGHLLATHLIPPTPESENSAALLATRPLEAGAQYTAEVIAVLDGRPYARSWRFTVAAQG